MENITTTWYQENALRTLKNFNTKEELYLNAYMGIIGEYGEFFDFIKKLYTHNLSEEKQIEVKLLAAKELGDVMWYLSTSLALAYNFTLQEVYSRILPFQEGDYHMDDIYLLDQGPFLSNDIFSMMLDFKRALNKLDYTADPNEIIDIVGQIILYIALILKTLFGMPISEILLANINKLRQRYPEGFSDTTANVRIDANKRYKEEEDTKVQR